MYDLYIYIYVYTHHETWKKGESVFLEAAICDSEQQK
jgi:hypothetical protein